MRAREPCLPRREAVQLTMSTPITMPIRQTSMPDPRVFIAAPPAASTAWVSCLLRHAHNGIASVPNAVVEPVNAVLVRLDAAPTKAAFSSVTAGFGSYAGRMQGSPPRGEPR